MATQLSQEVLGIIEVDEKEVKPIMPVQPGINKQPDEKDHNFWTTLEDMAYAVPQGIVNAIEAQGDFIDEIL